MLTISRLIRLQEVSQRMVGDPSQWICIVIQLGAEGHIVQGTVLSEEEAAAGL